MEQELSLGWLPDHPDWRDYSATDQQLDPPAGEKKVPEILEALGVAKPSFGEELQSAVDLSGEFSPVEDQRDLGSCTANAAAGLIEYFERRAMGQHVEASRIFIYKATRNLMNVTGDSGAYLRTTMQAVRTFGAPPESYWPYDVSNFDVEPSAFCYAFASNFKALQYYRLDPNDTDRETLLNRIKTNLSASLPSMFGFTVFSSIRQPAEQGEIPFPGKNESRLGGHAIVACGYDDAKKIHNPSSPDDPTVGALKIRNSWGTTWGEQGYGWLPYRYVTEGLAIDWWSLVRSRYEDVAVFGLKK